MSLTLTEQERQAIELFARAERRVPVTHSVVRFPLSLPSLIHATTPIPFRVRVLIQSSSLAQRRDALQHAIQLSRSSHASLKQLAAANVAKFFKAFPDLEEDAINAIYDLCEDQDQNVHTTLPKFLPIKEAGVNPFFGFPLFFRFGYKDTRLSCRCPSNSQDG